MKKVLALFIIICSLTFANAAGISGSGLNTSGAGKAFDLNSFYPRNGGGLFAKKIMAPIKGQVAELIVESNEAGITCSKILNRMNFYASDFKCVSNKKDAGDLPFTLILKPNKDIYTMDSIYNHGDDFDVETIPWDIKGTDPSTLAEGIEIVVAKLKDYLANSDTFKTLILNRGLSESTSIVPDGTGYYIVKDAMGNAVSRVSRDVALKLFAKESKRKKHYLRATIELALILGIGGANYWILSDSMAVDWDYENNSFKHIVNRFYDLDEWRFDNNSTSCNWSHTYAGALYFLNGRSNGLSFLESTMMTLAGSLLWEVVLERKEVVSINDHFFTGIGGTAMGEAAYQISQMLRTKNTPMAKVFAFIFDPMTTLNTFLDNPSNSRRIENSHKRFTDSFNFSHDAYGKFDIISGIVNSSDSMGERTLAQLGVDAEVVMLPIDQKGKIKKLVMDTVAAEIMTKGAFGKEGMDEFHMLIKTVFAGYAQGNIKEDGRGRLSGYTFFVGPSTGVRTQQKGGDEYNRDFLAAVNVLGSTMDVTVYHKGFRMRIVLDVFGDFAMIRPYGIQEFYSKGNSFAGSKSPLIGHDVYHAKGATGSVKAEVEYGRLSAGATASKGSYSSIDKWDRFQERITKNLKLTDKYSSIDIWFAYQLSDRLKAKIGMEKIFREGKIYNEDIKAVEAKKKDTETRYYGNIEYRFHGI